MRRSAPRRIASQSCTVLPDTIVRFASSSRTLVHFAVDRLFFLHGQSGLTPHWPYRKRSETVACIAQRRIRPLGHLDGKPPAATVPSPSQFPMLHARDADHSVKPSVFFCSGRGNRKLTGLNSVACSEIASGQRGFDLRQAKVTGGS